MQSKWTASDQLIEKPFIDLKPVAIIMNRGEFAGSGLDNITGKPHDGSVIPKWYEEERWIDIEAYVIREACEFVKFCSWLYRELPPLLARFKSER